MVKSVFFVTSKAMWGWGIYLLKYYWIGRVSSDKVNVSIQVSDAFHCFYVLSAVEDTQIHKIQKLTSLVKRSALCALFLSFWQHKMMLRLLLTVLNAFYCLTNQRIS